MGNTSAKNISKKLGRPVTNLDVQTIKAMHSSRKQHNLKMRQNAESTGQRVKNLKSEKLADVINDYIKTEKQKVVKPMKWSTYHGTPKFGKPWYQRGGNKPKRQLTKYNKFISNYFFQYPHGTLQHAAGLWQMQK